MPEPTREQWVAIQEHLAGGRMIEALKVYREATGVGLKEAKDAMEAYQEKLRAESPEQFPECSKSGCMGAVVLFAMILAGTAVVVHWIG